jgi:hypothetical protein
MPNFAIINGGNVVNVVVADDLETANELVKNTGMGEFAKQLPNIPSAPGIGWTWDGESFTAPVEKPKP